MQFSGEGFGCCNRRVFLQAAGAGVLSGLAGRQDPLIADDDLRHLQIFVRDSQ